MFVLVIDRLRQRIMTTVRILFLLALIAVLAVQLFGVMKTTAGWRSGKGGTGLRTTPHHPDALTQSLTRDLRAFYEGHY